MCRSVARRPGGRLPRWRACRSDRGAGDGERLADIDAECFDLPGDLGSRNITRPSTSENMKRSPYWLLMVLPCGYFRATVTGTLGGKSTTSRGVALGCGCHIDSVSSDRTGFGPGSSGRAGRDPSGGAWRGMKPSRSSISSMYCCRCFCRLVPAERVPVRHGRWRFAGPGTRWVRGTIRTSCQATSRCAGHGLRTAAGCGAGSSSGSHSAAQGPQQCRGVSVPSGTDTRWSAQNVWPHPSQWN